MITETIEYYNEMGDKPGFLLLLDARKAFVVNKVAYNVLFILSLGMSLCAKIVKLLLIVLYCIMRPYTDGPIGPLSYRHSSGVVRNPHSTLAE